jgi:cytochrome c-type biogenesis protein CcsB
VSVAVNENLSNLSNTLFTTAIATYAAAFICYTAEYAFGRRGRVADSAAVESRPVPSKVLIGSGGLTQDERPPADPPSSTVSSDVPAGPARPQRNVGNRFGQIAVIITVIGALLHVTSISIRATAVDSIPWSNMYEFASAAGLVAIVAFLVVLSRAPQLRYLGLFVMFPVVVLMFLAGTVLYSQASPLVPALQSYWLAIHVTAAASSEGVLMTSSVLTILYLIRRQHDARTAAGQTSRFATFGERLPAAASLDKAAYRLAAFAFPIYTFGVIAGAIWAEAAWGRYWGWDPKETWAFIAWVVYAAYLHARATGGFRKYAPYINLLGFGAITFNFFVVNIVISGLHSYAGIN